MKAGRELIYELGTPEEQGIEPHTMVVLEQADPAMAPVAPDLRRYDRLRADQRPAVAIVASEPGAVRMVMFFRSPKLDEVKALVDADPLVAAGKLTAHVWQQWLGKGTLAG